MSMNKIANIPLETTADYQSLSKLAVQFWNQDKNTAILQFKITRNDYPLALGEENVKVFIALESGDSFLVDDKIDYLDEMEGIVSYTIPTDFMRVAGDVTGQVYVTTLDEEEVVVQRQFSFTVKNDLIANLPAEDKIREIKYFADMRAEVAQMMNKLNSDFEDMNDYVTQVEGTTQAGINELKNLITQKEKAYNDNHTKKMKELTDKGNQYTSDLTDQRNYIDSKYTDFQNAVNGSGLVTTGQSANWQKAKLTKDDGFRTYCTKGSVKDMKALTPGFYETVVAGTTDATEFPTASYGSFVEFDIMKSDAGRMQLKVVISANGRTFNKYVHTDGAKDTGWLEVPQFIDASVVETQTSSQNKANTAESNAKTYTDTKVKSINTVLYEGTANGVNTTINLSETLDNFIMLYVYVSYPGGIVPVMASPFGSNNMPIQVVNILDADGNGGGIYECILSKVNRTQLKITNDVYFDLGTQTGSGANANKLTITKIVGVRSI